MLLLAKTGLLPFFGYGQDFIYHSVPFGQIPVYFVECPGTSLAIMRLKEQAAELHLYESFEKAC